MATLPHMPLFIDAIEADCSYMDDREFGLYMRLLMLMWRSPEGIIPADDNWIAKRLRLTPMDFNVLLKPILEEHCTLFAHANAKQMYMQKRLKKEYDYVVDKVEKRRAAAQARWGTDNKEENGMQMHSKSNAPTPTPTPTVLDIYIEGIKHNKDTLFELFWNTYPAVRPKGNKGKAKDKFEQLFKLMTKGELNHEEIINRCKEYRSFCEQGGNYNQHAVTWLNQRGWETDWASQTSTAPARPQSRGSQRASAGGLGEVIDAAEKAKEVLRRQDEALRGEG